MAGAGGVKNQKSASDKRRERLALRAEAERALELLLRLHSEVADLTTPKDAVKLSQAERQAHERTSAWGKGGHDDNVRTTG